MNEQKLLSKEYYDLIDYIKESKTRNFKRNCSS